MVLRLILAIIAISASATPKTNRFIAVRVFVAFLLIPILTTTTPPQNSGKKKAENEVDDEASDHE